MSSAARPLRAPEDEAGCRGKRFWLLFCAIEKSDWPRAAIEREGGKDQSSFHQTLRCAQGERGGNPTFGDYATTLTLALSRAAGEGIDLRFA